MKTFYWNHKPGFFTNYETGEVLKDDHFMGTIGEWYRTLALTIKKIDENYLGSACKSLIVSPDVGVIIEHLTMFRPPFSDGKFEDGLTTRYNQFFLKKIGKLYDYEVNVYKFQPNGLVVLSTDSTHATLKILDLPEY